MTHKTPLELKQIRWIVLFLTMLSVLLLTNASLFTPIEISSSLPLHTALETATIVIFASVFIVCWNAFDVIRKTSSVIVAVAFLCTAIFEFLHTISFQGKPSFLSAGDMHTSMSFWLLSRYIVAATLFGLAIKRNDTQISNKKALGILGVGLSFTTLISLIIFLAPDYLPTSYLDARGQRIFTLISEGSLTFLNFLTALQFYRQDKLNHPKLSIAPLQIERTYLFLASCMLALAQIYFYPYFVRGENLSLIGHILQLFAALAIYRSMVAINIHAPYTTLANAVTELHTTSDELSLHKNRLTGIIETAIDGIVTIDKMQKIVVINPAAAAMFGYTVESLQNTFLDDVIPARHRKNHGEHITKFGDTGASKRKMGSSFEDFYVTGLRANGTEFPIEASISSSLENGERFYTVIFRDITERKNAKDKVALYHTQLSQLSTALQSIREEERKHIARELHDDLGQLLAALRMDLSLLQRDSLLTEKSKKTVHSMDQLILTSITTLRRIASDLRPRALDEGGLFYALKTLQKEFSNRYQIDCELIANEEQLALDDAHSTAIFRVVQESLTNVARHAAASEVQIEFHRDASSIRFTIHDNGRGIDEEDMKKTRSFGLVGMRERIKAMQGEFSVISSSGDGTHLEICLPLSKSSDAS